MAEGGEIAGNPLHQREDGGGGYEVGDGNQPEGSALEEFASATTIYTLVQWIPSYLTNFRHVPFKNMGGWITVGYLLATVLTLLVGYLADRTMRRALAGAWVSVAFVLLIFPAQMLSASGSALLISTLIFVASSTGALNGALMHTMVRPEAIARGTGAYAGIGILTSAIGPMLFGMLITKLGGQYWAGFAFLAVLNVIGAIAYLAMHRLSVRARQAHSTLAAEMDTISGEVTPAAASSHQAP